MTAARDEGLIVITAGAGDVVRLVPPLNITNDDVDLCISILSGVLNSLQNQNPDCLRVCNVSQLTIAVNYEFLWVIRIV